MKLAHKISLFLVVIGLFLVGSSAAFAEGPEDTDDFIVAPLVKENTDCCITHDSCCEVTDYCCYMAAPIITILDNNITVEAKVTTKRFKLYGLDCTICYLNIVRKVSKLPGVKKVHFYRSNKTLVITGEGYSMKEVRRIVQSEKQRIVG